MFAHVSLGVKDIKQSIDFYYSVMPALGYDRLFGDPSEGFMAYGPEEAFFIICTPLDETGSKPTACNGTHICLKAPDSKVVDAFFAAEIKAGAKDAGQPGIRKEYANNYYAAFIHDPDGHKIEAMAKV